MRIERRSRPAPALPPRLVCRAAGCGCAGRAFGDVGRRVAAGIMQKVIIDFLQVTMYFQDDAPSRPAKIAATNANNRYS